MPNYLHVCQGVLAASFPWSFRMYSTSSATESVAETNWNSGISAMFNTAAFLALLPVGVNVTGTYTSTMNSNWKQTTKTSSTLAIDGTATTALPYEICEVVTWRTAQSTHYGHGRSYLPCLGTGALATGGYYLSSTAQGDIQSAVNALLSQIIGTLQPVILHRKGTKSGPGPLTTDNIIAGDVPNGFAVQRRRADKRVPTRVSLSF